MYTTKNYKTKKALKEAVAACQNVTFFQPGPFGGSEPVNGNIVVEGPHYPAPHTWYASCEVRGGVIVKVK